MSSIQSQGQEWEVEKILQRGRFKNITHYLILWKGFSPDQATWEPITNLQHCQQAIIDFEKGLKTIVKETPPVKKEKKKKINFDNIFKSSEVNDANAIKIEGNQIHSLENQILQKMPQNEIIAQLSKKSIEPHLKLSEIQSSIKEGTNLLSKNEGKSNAQAAPEILIPLRQTTNEDPSQIGLSRKKIKLNQLEPIKQVTISNKQSTYNSNSQQVYPIEAGPLIKERQFFKDKGPSKKVCSNIQSAIKKNCQQSLQEIRPLTEGVQEKLQSQIKSLIVNEAKKGEKVVLKDTKHFQSLSIDLSRYNLCDNELQLQQKECLINILRKKTGEKKTKPSIKIVDISNKEEFLNLISSLKLVANSSSLEYIDLLIKVRYGWMAVGRTHDSEYIMIDVNLIRQESWNSLKKYLCKD